MQDVLIVGAGIIGCALAEQLSRRGVRVRVLDARDLAAQTSAAGMGHLVALGDAPAQFALAAHSLKLWRDLQPQLPANVEYRNTGTLWLATDEQEREAALAERDRYLAAGIRAEWWSAADVLAHEPALTSQLCGALRVPDDAVIYPPNAARFFAESAKQSGAQFELNCSVRRVAPGEVHLQDGRVLSAPRVVVATGVATPQLLPMLKLLPRKGHLLITTRQVPRIHHQLVELGYHHSAHAHDPVSVAFNAQPRATGQILLGSSRQFDDESTDLVMPVLSRMLARAERYLPGVLQWPALRAWTGLRPCTPDNLPYLGAVSCMPGVYVAAGHEGLGITTATGTADVMARLLCEESPVLELSPFSPDRLVAREAA